MLCAIRLYCGVLYGVALAGVMILQLCLVPIVRSERPSGSRCCRGRAQGSMDCNSNSTSNNGSNSNSNSNINSNIKVDYNII